MKAAFNIQPVTEEKIPLHLLIEAGNYGVSLIWFSKDPFAVKGLVVYNFFNTDIAAELDDVFRLHGNFKNISSTTICYNFKESLLVPVAYYQPSINTEILSQIYGEDATSYIKTDFINAANIYNIYRIQRDIELTFSRIFPSATIFHSSSLQVELLHTGEKNTNLYCTIFHNTIKVILYRNSVLQIVQQFNYNTPADVAYHLLNVCHQNEVRADETNLKLNGMVDGHSILYKELYSYFINIDFENLPEQVPVQEEMKMLPAHFFSHLTALASCVS